MTSERIDLPDDLDPGANLQRHVARTTSAWAGEHPERRWQQVDGTLVFADISGFTALSERLAERGHIGAEELVETLSRVFGAMLDAADERGGVLLKFGGDALLFLFTGEDHVRRACVTTVEMRTALRRAAATPTSVGRLRLSMSVGVHSGDVDLFLVGAPHRELVVLGPSASAVIGAESAAEPGQILCSPSTVARLPPNATRDRGDGHQLLRWRQAPTTDRVDRPATAPDADLLRGLLPDALADVLERGAPEPEHRIATLAFLRYSGTDALLAEQGHDAVAEALDATVTGVLRCFADEDVTLLTIDVDADGGKFFAGSGIPAASEDDEASMLRAVRRILALDLPLPLQAGVNRGHVFVAEVGSTTRAAYSAMGDTTNTAARICAKAPPGHVFAHPNVAEHSRTVFELAPVGPFLFKGKAAPMDVYEVGAEVGVREARGDDLPLFGRDDEIARLRTIVRALVDDGRGQVLTVDGDTGMGKSRLLRHVLDAEGVTTSWMRAEPYGATSPYRMVRDQVRGLLGVQRGDPAAMARALQAGVEAVAPDVTPLLPLVADVAHVEVPSTPEVDAIDTRFRPDRTADALIALIDATVDGPLVLVAEDAHWADEASGHLLSRVVDACLERPWLLVVTRRDRGTGFQPEGGETLELAPLDDETVRALVVESTRTRPLREHEVDAIVARAGGNPLFVSEILRTVREVGSLDAVPDSLAAAMAAQIDALEPTARRALRYASVLGRSFRARVLHDVLTSEGVLLDPMRRQMLDAFLEQDGPTRLHFRNAMVRDVAYEGLAYRLRTRLHRGAGQVLELLSTDRAADADTLATHFELAGDAPRTWHYSLLAAERSQRAYANAAAATHYRRALAASRRIPTVDDATRSDIWTSLGDVTEFAGIYDEAIEAYRRAMRLSDDPVQRAELHLKRARTRERSGAFSLALRELSLGQRALSAADTENESAAELAARLGSFGAMIRFGQERLADARRRAVAAADAARESGALAALAESLSVIDISSLYLGLPTDGNHLREAVAIYHQLGDRRMAARTENNLGNLLFHAGEWDTAIEHLERSRTENLLVGDAEGAATTASNLGEILLVQDRLDLAEPYLLEAVRVLRAIGYVDGAAYAEVQYARLLVRRERLDEADEVLARVRGEFESLGQVSSVLEAAVVQAESRLQRGKPAEAVALLDQAEDQAGAEAELLLARVSLVRAEALAALGHHEQLADVIDSGLGAARDQGLAMDEALLVVFRARHAGALGEDVDHSELGRAEAVLARLRRAGSPASETS